ncbi:MAG: hypothetical protein ACKOTE_19495, partial [Opitutaceae bacterium]
FVVASDVDTYAIRKALRLTDPDPKRDQDLSNHSGLLVLGNDRTNRWGGMPSGSDPTQIASTFDRIARTVSLQEYAGFGRPS